MSWVVWNIKNGQWPPKSAERQVSIARIKHCGIQGRTNGGYPQPQSDFSRTHEEAYGSMQTW